MSPPRENPVAKAGRAKRPDPRTEAIVAVLKSIPRGKVAAYGQVAALAGQPRGARQVARLLHSLSGKRGLPWHRVINREGRISLPIPGPGELQASLLRREGVKVDPTGKVDLRAHGWTAGTARASHQVLRR